MSPWARARLRRGGRGGGGERRPPATPKAQDLDALKKTVDDAAAVGGGLWFSYLFVQFYLAVASGAVTHADLFFEKPVKLPFLNIELPLLAFFSLAPFLFLVVHAYTLLHLVMLTEKAKRYDEKLYEKLGGENNKATRDGLRGQLPSNIFVQFLAGPPRMRDGPFGIALRGVAWLTLVVGPVLLLLLLQLQFLPYHSSPITWAHRVALILDLGLIWWLWRKILFWAEGDDKHWFATWNWSVTGMAVSFVAVVFSIFIATYRGEHLPDWSADLDKGNWLSAVHGEIFDSHFDEQSGRRLLPFSDTLVLSNVNALVELGIDDPKKAEWRDYIFRAAGRDLKGAIFDHANMARINFDGAHLEGANMLLTQMDRASFNDARLQGASLFRARLPGVSLVRALLQGASLNDTQLQGALLYSAQLQGAALDDAQLQGASLDGAQLQGAALFDAQLQGASLYGAQLQGAALFDAQLQGASLLDAQLQGASLDGARLLGASLDGAQLQGASLERAQLQGASLDGATVAATTFDQAFFWRTKLNLYQEVKPSVGASGATWEPLFVDKSVARLWDQTAYETLHKQIEALPTGDLRDKALDRIRTLDCSNTTLATCEPPDLKAALLEFRNSFPELFVPPDDFRKALADTLRTLVCPGDAQTLYVVRGRGFISRIEAAGPEARSLVDDLRDKNSEACPVAAYMTEADRSLLAKIEAHMPVPAVPGATPLTAPSPSLIAPTP